jgi:hypothetical protein
MRVRLKALEREAVEAAMEPADIGRNTREKFRV